MSEPGGRVYVKRSVSLRPDQVEEIKRIADEEKQPSFSRVIQVAIDRDLARREAEAAQEREAVTA